MRTKVSKRTNILNESLSFAERDFGFSFYKSQTTSAYQNRLMSVNHSTFIAIDIRTIIDPT